MPKYIDINNNTERYQKLDKYIELSEKVLKVDDPRTRYKGLSNLLGKINLDIPDVIELCAPLWPEVTNYRFSQFVGETYHHLGMDNEFLNCIFLLKNCRKDIEEYESDDEDKRKERNEKLDQYAQTVKIELPNHEVHPDIIYCEKGIYRKYRRYYRTVCFRMGRLIQTSDLVVGDLKTTMYLVYLYWALSNERAMAQEEISLYGAENAMTTEATTQHTHNKHNGNPTEWIDISNLRDKASHYVDLIQRSRDYIIPPERPDIKKTVNELHDAISHIDVDSLPTALSGFNTNQTHIVSEMTIVVSVINGLTALIGDYLPDIKKFDPRAAEVLKFCKKVNPIMHQVLQTLESRRQTDPTFDDEKAMERFKCFLMGDYDDMSIDEFVPRHIINGISQTEAIRRLNHIIDQCADEQTKRSLRKFLNWHGFDADVTRDKQHNNTSPTPEPETAIAEASTPTTSPDFPHMKSYTPTISFDMSALYSFLIDEGVICDVDEALFSNCISHAHVNELWANGVTSKLKLVIHHLKKHYSQDWFNTLCRNLDMTKQQMGKFNVPTRLQFEQRMKMLK